MQNFTFYNPVKIVFGKGSIAKLSALVPSDGKVLLAFGGGSIMKNGVYDQVVAALKGRSVVEFGGIEANPRYETLMKAVELVKREDIRFLLSVGGGSVLDGVKFIAAAVPFEGADPWEILSQGAPVKKALPLGAVLTLPATGSEMNSNSVVSREATKEKLAFSARAVFPQFSILDPETTYSLPPRQIANGVVDAFAHVTEQYMTYPADAPLQDRMAEAVLSTLIEIGPEAMNSPPNYEAKANLMWAATMALNGIISVGVPQDWATHGIGHELTALYGLDHAQTLAVVMPAMFRHQKARKREKLLQYAERVWGIQQGGEDERIEKVIEQTEAFFKSLGVKTRLAEYGVAGGWEEVSDRLEKRGTKLGEHRDLGPAEVREILALCAK
jgi:NADP-dependent alcohol dehydrogenase